ncbi:MAG: hypothetical protein MZV70_41715 [Desulfobacterales bacterium]|nr:hypothetical protein [Desulfobacterales bacterium]
MDQRDVATCPVSLDPVLFIAFLAGIVGLAVWSLPSGYSADVSQVGQGRNVVVQVHDHNLVSSTNLMNSLEPGARRLPRNSSSS